MIEPLLTLRRSVLLPRAARTHVGRPVFTMAELVRDLELRVGAVPLRASTTLRVQRFVARMRTLLDETPYWARAFEADPWRTARELLARRDALILAGWNGQPFLGDDVSPRLRALADLELVFEPALPAGLWDRARQLERLLRERGLRPYERLTLLDPTEELPGRVTQILEVLRELGVTIDGSSCGAAMRVDGPASPPDDGELSDLAKARRVFARGGRVMPFRGDGTVRLLRAETPLEAAEWAASELARLEGTVAVVLGPESELLSRALEARGLPTFGTRRSSQARPLASVLGLALRVATTPPDPVAAWQLLTLPGGPFDGTIGQRLARALVEMPAIGGAAWNEALLDLARTGASTALVSEWFGQEGPSRDEPVARAHVEAVAERVHRWAELADRVSPEHASTAGAIRRALEAFREGFADAERTTLSWAEVLARVDDVAAPIGLALTHEEAGRVDACDDPGGLLSEVDHVVWWGYVGAGAADRDEGWTNQESRTLAARGIDVSSPSRRMAALWKHDRRPFFAAQRSILLVAPDVLEGERRAPHPGWDELVALAGAPESVIARGRSVGERQAPALPLPACGPAVSLPTPPAFNALPLSATSLETALACPLRDVLERHLRLRAGWAALPRGPLLYGTLSHRLLEVLHADEAANAKLDELPGRAAQLLEQLLREEAQPLLSRVDPFERADAFERICSGVVELFARLRAAGLRIESVELPVEGVLGSAAQPLRGRVDLLLRDPEGLALVVDLKWGASRYVELLRNGRALQLMAYAHLLAEPRGSPKVTFYSVSGRKLLPPVTVGDDWARVERTFDALAERLRAGTVLVPAAPGARPLADELGLDAARVPPDASCGTCRFDAVCGRRWRPA